LISCAYQAAALGVVQQGVDSLSPKSDVPFLRIHVVFRNANKASRNVSTLENLHSIFTSDLQITQNAQP
jgi:hypothetical protein